MSAILPVLQIVNVYCTESPALETVGETVLVRVKSGWATKMQTSLVAEVGPLQKQSCTTPLACAVAARVFPETSPAAMV